MLRHRLTFSAIRSRPFGSPSFFPPIKNSALQVGGEARWHGPVMGEIAADCGSEHQGSSYKDGLGLLGQKKKKRCPCCRVTTSKAARKSPRSPSMNCKKVFALVSMTHSIVTVPTAIEIL